MPIKSARRHALLKCYARLAEEEVGLAAAWHGKQLALRATALPPTFPCATKLAAGRYYAFEDLDGADAEELMDNAGVSRREAEAILVAAAFFGKE